MCFDKRVIGGIALVAVALLAINPTWFGAALPFLLLAICPLSMVAMMRTKNGNSAACTAPVADDADLERLRAEVAGLRAEIATKNSAANN